MKKYPPLETRDDKYYARQSVKTMYDVAMGSYFDRFSSNGCFFTVEEFKQNKGKIFTLTGAKTKLDSIIDKL